MCPNSSGRSAREPGGAKVTDVVGPVAGGEANAPARRDADRAVLHHELKEAEEVVEATERRRDRHLLWSALGVSPALLVPLALGWTLDGIGAVGVITACVAMTGYEAIRAVREQRKLPELRRVAEERRAELAE